MKGEKWLSIEEASEYLNIGKTILYTRAREGKIPARKVGKKWTFNKDELDRWMSSGDSVHDFFTSVDFNIDDNPLLREPQREGYAHVYDYFKKEGGKNAMLQIPVGCGKSGLASILPFGIAKGRMLVISPNLTIKQGLYDAMDITNRRECFWKKAKVLEDKDMLTAPLACTLDSGNISVAEKSHVVITNVQQLATNVNKWLKQFSHDFFDLIVIDEAHHSAAMSWKTVLEHFPNAKVVLLTATPFRSDKQEIDGELIYRYPFKTATMRGYIKRLKASYVAPEEITLSFTDEGGKTYTLDEVMKLKEETWFSKGIALSKKCNASIVDASIQKLEELRQTGTRHQIIAVACSINHAKQVRSLYEERGYNADVIHSKQDPDKNERVISELKNGTLDCIIQVQMLGEGFDHPKLSVAAIFNPFRSLAPYVQFVGRIMRVVAQNNPYSPDNLGHIVTHLGMNLDKRVDEFTLFEKDDKAFWESVVGGEEPTLPPKVKDGDARLTIRETPVTVNNEIVQGLFEEDFVSLDDEQVINELRMQFEALGLDPDAAEKIVKDKLAGMKPSGELLPSQVQPQRQLEEAQKRLNEQINRTARILLNNVGLKDVGVELPFKYKSLNIRANNNIVAAIKMVNVKANEINKNKKRKDLSVEEIQLVESNLEKILQKLVRQVKKVQSEYEES